MYSAKIQILMNKKNNEYPRELHVRLSNSSRHLGLGFAPLRAKRMRYFPLRSHQVNKLSEFSALAVCKAQLCVFISSGVRFGIQVMARRPRCVLWVTDQNSDIQWNMSLNIHATLSNSAD